MSAHNDLFRRRPLLISATVSVCLLITLFVVVGVRQSARPRTADYATKQLTVGTDTYHMQVADNDLKRELGLSNRYSLAAKTGMVFTYSQPQQLCFWMKDMRFAIDMVWLDQAKRIVAVEPSVPPDSYPKTFCHQAQYVLEFAAGVAYKEQLQVGKQLAF